MHQILLRRDDLNPVRWEMQALPIVMDGMKKLPFDTRLKPVFGAFLLTPIIWWYPQVMGLGVWAIKAAITGIPGTLHHPHSTTHVLLGHCIFNPIRAATLAI